MMPMWDSLLFCVGYCGRIGIKVSNKPDEIVSRAKCFVSNIRESLISSGSLGVNQGIRVKWHPPSSGWVKINVDGSSNMNGHYLMVGGVVRDSTGNWLEGFKKYIGRGSALKSELWAILIGLKVMILGNSMNTPLMTLILQIMKAKRQFQEVKFQFVPNE
ncbi:hypothetical protein Godav_003160, partial [Gossypium davidsonii]|nr:hypothetical protein [Gossypium davidsonii]